MCGVHVAERGCRVERMRFQVQAQAIGAVKLGHDALVSLQRAMASFCSHCC